MSFFCSCGTRSKNQDQWSWSKSFLTTGHFRSWYGFCADRYMYVHLAEFRHNMINYSTIVYTRRRLRRSYYGLMKHAPIRHHRAVGGWWISWRDSTMKLINCMIVCVHWSRPMLHLTDCFQMSNVTVLRQGINIMQWTYIDKRVATFHAGYIMAKHSFDTRLDRCDAIIL